MISDVPSEATTRLASGKRTIVADLEAALEQFREIEDDLKGGVIYGMLRYQRR